MDEELRERLDRIETLLLAIFNGLADEQGEGEEPPFTLDGEPLGCARDRGLPL